MKCGGTMGSRLTAAWRMTSSTDNIVPVLGAGLVSALLLTAGCSTAGQSTRVVEIERHGSLEQRQAIGRKVIKELSGPVLAQRIHELAPDAPPDAIGTVSVSVLTESKHLDSDTDATVSLVCRAAANADMKIVQTVLDECQEVVSRALSAASSGTSGP